MLFVQWTPLVTVIGAENRVNDGLGISTLLQIQRVIEDLDTVQHLS